MINEVKKILKERGYNKFILWCLKENKNARFFYEKMGGKLSEKRKFEIGNKEYDEVAFIYDF